MTTLPFGERYAVLNFSDGGIIVDLSTGDYTRLNVTAAIVCKSLLEAGDRAVATATIARRLRIGDGEAKRAVDTVMTALETPGTRRHPTGPFQFSRAKDGIGYVASWLGTPRLHVSEDGLTIRVLTPGQVTAGDLHDCVRAAIPKILFLRGAAVIHGASCVSEGSLRAFCGESGAGKTTTARAFASAGTTLISEDLLILASTRPLTVYADGESVVHRWARVTTQRLVDAPDSSACTSDIQVGLAGDRLTLNEIWVLDSSRRHSHDRLAPRRLSPTEAAVAVMGNLFLGSAAPAGWNRFLELATTVAASVPMFDAPMPQGVDRLVSAARLYAENSAS